MRLMVAFDAAAVMDMASATIFAGAALAGAWILLRIVGESRQAALAELERAHRRRLVNEIEVLKARRGVPTEAEVVG
jgi:hypothetical protein